MSSIRKGIKHTNPCKSRKWLFLFVLILISSLFIFSSCKEEPTGLGEPPGTGEWEVDPGQTGEFLLAAIEIQDSAMGKIEVWASNMVVDHDSNRVSFDAVIVNKTNRPLHAPIYFVITSIVPPGVKVANPDGYDTHRNPYFDFSEKVGNDEILNPGEASDSVRFEFSTRGEIQPFSISFRIDFDLSPSLGVIGGVVFADLNKNGERDRCEPGIPGVLVKMRTHPQERNELIWGVKTNRWGEYRFGRLHEGVYTISIEAPSEWEYTTSNPLIVTLIEDENGNVQNFLRAWFGLYNPRPPQVETLFGPLTVGPFSRVGTEVDTTFFAPIYRDTSNASFAYDSLDYYLTIEPPMTTGPMPLSIDSVVVKINDGPVFIYSDSLKIPEDWDRPFPRGIIKIPGGLVSPGENGLYILVTGDDHSALIFRIFRKFNRGYPDCE